MEQKSKPSSNETYTLYINRIIKYRNALLVWMFFLLKKKRNRKKKKEKLFGLDFCYLIS